MSTILQVTVSPVACPKCGGECDTITYQDYSLAPDSQPPNVWRADRCRAGCTDIPSISTKEK